MWYFMKLLEYRVLAILVVGPKRMGRP